MANRITLRLYGALTAAVLLVASPAAAQFTPRSLNDPATGEQFHIEGAAGFWMPTANMSISSQALGIPGSDIDFKKDLGLTDQRLSELQVVVYDIPRRSIAGYYPECNGLIPLWHYAEGSKVPAAKSIPVRIFKEVVPEIIEGGEIPISTT